MLGQRGLSVSDPMWHDRRWPTREYVPVRAVPRAKTTPAARGPDPSTRSPPETAPGRAPRPAPSGCTRTARCPPRSTIPDEPVALGEVPLEHLQRGDRPRPVVLEQRGILLDAEFPPQARQADRRLDLVLLEEHPLLYQPLRANVRRQQLRAARQVQQDRVRLGEGEAVLHDEGDPPEGIHLAEILC